MLPVIVRPEAVNDLIDTYKWYEQKRQGLGDDFMLRVEAAVESIKHSPKLCARVYMDVRRKLLRRYPYGIFYVIGKNNVSILAVMHAKRHPDRWQRRV